MANNQITLKHAIENDMVFSRCCGGCGSTRSTLYIMMDGMYAGMAYCRICIVEPLNDKEEEE